MSEPVPTKAIPNVPSDRSDMLTVENLDVVFGTAGGRVHAVDGVSFAIGSSEAVAVVGESGSGKSTTAMALMRLLSTPPAEVTGQVRFHGNDLLAMAEEELNRIRGQKISMIFQESRASLNPSKTVGKHLMEVLRYHRGMSKSQARERAREILEAVSIPDPEKALDAYPHELSGGMCQRVMIALGLLCDPELMLADEPTASLDPTTGLEILELLSEVRRTNGTSIVIITHNLALAARFTDRVMVMYAGQIVEVGSSHDVLTHPEMPYTEGLLESIPQAADSTTRRLKPIPGVAMHGSQGPGCRFADRCPYVQDVCRSTVPPLVEVRTGRWARCLFPTSLREQSPDPQPVATAREDNVAGDAR